jgi:hypothetical protein
MIDFQLVVQHRAAGVLTSTNFNLDALEHCQAYSWQKNDYHFNVALTVGSLAKVAYHLRGPGEAVGAFSIADIKQRHMNEYQAQRILSVFRLDLDEALIRKLLPKISNFGLRNYKRA